MMQPPQFENVVTRFETLQLLIISLVSFLACAMVVLTVSIYRMGSTLRDLRRIFEPQQPLMTKQQAEELTRRAL